MPKRVTILNGPNLNTLGTREPHIYGKTTLAAIEASCREFADSIGLRLAFKQTNHEGELVEHLHRLGGLADAIVINPGAWTHYAWAIRDALEIAGLPAVEVHLSDVDAREEFRKVSVIRDLCFATVKGEGVEGYRTALAAIKEKLEI
jgi:3-dehydroquinate dehydratase-2